MAHYKLLAKSNGSGAGRRLYFWGYCSTSRNYAGKWVFWECKWFL